MSDQPTPQPTVILSGQEALGLYDTVDWLLARLMEAGSRVEGAKGLTAEECMFLADHAHTILGHIGQAYEWHTGRPVDTKRDQAPFGWTPKPPG